MPDDALGKAAKALRERLRTHYCERCANRPYDSPNCLRRCCPLSHVLWDDLSGAARAVLEAVGVKDLARIIGDLMTLAIQVAGCLEVREQHCMCPIIEWPPDGAHIAADEYCPCEWSKVMARAKAALERAGRSE